MKIYDDDDGGGRDLAALKLVVEVVVSRVCSRWVVSKQKEWFISQLASGAGCGQHIKQGPRASKTMTSHSTRHKFAGPGKNKAKQGQDTVPLLNH